MTHEPVQIAAADATLIGDRWRGDGATIVLLHAGVCDRRSWRDVGAALGDAGRDVVAYDRRGFGEVAPAGAPFRHVDDLLAVLDAVAPDAPAWLVGSSMGGGVALDAALEAPERVAGLVLLAPAISGDPEPRRGGLQRRDGRARGGDRCRLDGRRVRGMQPARNPAVARRAGRARGTGERSAARAGTRHEPHRDRQRRVRGRRRQRSRRRGRLHEIAIPAIVACGELDIALKVRRSAELADALPSATYRSLPGRAHLPYLEAPDEIAALIMDAVV